MNPFCRESDLSLKRAYGLCQRMMHFFHQYLLHVTFEVLEPLWLTLQKGVQSATSLDEVQLILSSLMKISLLNAENG